MEQEYEPIAITNATKIVAFKKAPSVSKTDWDQTTNSGDIDENTYPFTFPSFNYHLQLPRAITGFVSDDLVEIEVFLTTTPRHQLTSPGDATGPTNGQSYNPKSTAWYITIDLAEIASYAVTSYASPVQVSPYLIRYRAVFHATLKKAFSSLPVIKFGFRLACDSMTANPFVQYFHSFNFDVALRALDFRQYLPVTVANGYDRQDSEGGQSTDVEFEVLY